jgi:polysaccharide biosynthesis transport protein
MRIIDFVRLIRKHIVLLVAAPLIMASLVIFLTMKPRFIYSSHTTLYTGLATGSTVELEKSFNFSAASTAFDNLINVIKSRETLQEVSIRLLSQHLLLGKYDPKYISAKSYEQLQKITPPYIYSLVANVDVENPRRQGINNTDSPDNENWRGFVAEKELYEADVPDLFPPSINRDIYEKTVEKLTQLMKSSDTNFVYELLNYEHPHYSLKALSGIKVQRIANSDLVKVEYQVDDPGLSQQTLAILNVVCSRNYRKVRETRSDDVLKYFETQVSESAARLKSAEDKLLEFNAGNSFINYSEQSRAVATSKEDLEVEYNKSKAQLAGVEASIKRLEEKLGNQQQIQLKSARILEMKKQLGDLIYQISSAERSQPVSQNEVRNLDELKTQAEQLKTNIKKEVDELYAYSKTTDGMPASTITTEWINNVVEAENIKGRLQVMEEQIKEFKQQYASYVPAGANIKRIEREITVSEQQFLENLHGLNLARLKLQDNELASNIKTVDPPYYPLSPIPTKRKILVIAATILTGIIIFSIILISEYFDETLKNPLKASLKMRLPLIGIFPKVFLNTNVLNFPFILNRLLEIIVQNIELYFKSNHSTNPVKTILIFSTMHMEGKTTITGNIAQKLISQGKKVLVLNYSKESLNEGSYWWK